MARLGIDQRRDRGLASQAIVRGSPLLSIDETPSRLRAVTAADVQRVAASMLADDRPRVVIVGAGAKTADVIKLGIEKVVAGDWTAAKASP